MEQPDVSAKVDIAALDDMALAHMACQRDGAAFRTITQRNNRRLYRIARAVVRDDDEAQDVVQEAYLRAFASLADFRGESSLATWLSRIVLNEALGRVRRFRPTVDMASIETDRPSSGALVPLPLASTQPDPERSMAQREIQALLERAIDALPNAFRVVLVARVVEEMSVEETADLFGLRPETVKTRLHRARRILRDSLEKQVGPVLTDAFPFAGRRCERTTNEVLKRLALAF
jgi:RNA polymerase sigma-70 factor (ECF subfamily)